MDGDPIPSTSITDATTGGLSVIVITGGSTGDVLTLQANGTYAPATPSGGGGSGDVVGPSSSTDNAIARFDATTGKLLQNSVVTVGDTGNIVGLGTVSCGAITANGDCNLASTGAKLLFEGQASVNLYRFATALKTDAGFQAVSLNVSNTVTTNAVGSCFGGSTFSATTMLGVLNLNAARVPFAIRLAASQSANAMTVETSGGGSVVYSLSAAGNITCGAVTASGALCAGTYTVATLPTASANAYKFATVSDSSVTTFGSTVAGGGSSKVMVYSNGTNWTVCAA